jgi:glycosyltransferase involved in cell wall biosynthesis
VRIAYYSPLPPDPSGVADYSALLLPELRRRLDVDVVERGRRARRGAHLGVFHIGNSPEAHGWIVRALHERRGLVVLHEYVVHHLVAGVTVGQGEPAGYLDAMQREAGVVGRLLAHGVVDGLLPPLWERRAVDFPLTREVLAPADGLIVHSRYVEGRVRDLGYTGPVFRVPHPAWPVPEVAPWPSQAKPLVAVLGHLNPQKRIGSVLAAFAQLRESCPEARLVVAGRAAGVDERELAGDGVDVLGYVDEPTLWSVLAAADVCVSLRSPTMGETSGVVLRALSAGVPVVVSDIGWFAELPDEAAVKIPTGEGEAAALAAALERLAADPAEGERLGAAGRELARTQHDVGRAAELYAAACEDVAARPAVENALLHNVARAAAELGIEPGAAVAAAAGEVTRGD